MSYHNFCQDMVVRPTLTFMTTLVEPNINSRLTGAVGSIDSIKLIAFMAQFGPHPYKEE